MSECHSNSSIIQKFGNRLTRNRSEIDGKNHHNLFQATLNSMSNSKAGSSRKILTINGNGQSKMKATLVFSPDNNKKISICSTHKPSTEFGGLTNRLRENNRENTANSEKD